MAIQLIRWQLRNSGAFALFRHRDVDETFIKAKGRLVYLYRAIDQDRNLLDVLLSEKRDKAAAEVFFGVVNLFISMPVIYSSNAALLVRL